MQADGEGAANPPGRPRPPAGAAPPGAPVEDVGQVASPPHWQTLSAGSSATAPQTVQAAFFTATVFAGAVLLFWIQPLFVKMALPLLGGAPLVWNTAMVFFQAMLLAGYAYAHVLTRWLGVRSQLAVHALVLCAAALALPVGVAESWQPDTAAAPAAWLLALLLVSLGAPFFALAATAPLLQRWFSLGRHPHARDPYFLYAASNAGSVAVVLAFPFVLEPLLATGAQSAAWSFGFAALAFGVVACGASLWRGRSHVRVGLSQRAAAQDPGDGAAATAPVSWRQRAGWLAYSAVPSALLLGVTAHISTDIASAPLLWVVPLALYLLTFVNAFARRPLIPLAPSARAMSLMLVLLAAVFHWREPAGVFLPLHLGAFFCIALTCHAELARRRPAAAKLTEFYLYLSLGGVTGGVLVALVAPVVFDSVLEYPIALVLAAALLPRVLGQAVPEGGRIRLRDLALAALIAAAVLFTGPVLAFAGLPMPTYVWTGLLVSLAAVALSRRGRPPAFALCIAALLLAAVSPIWSDDTVWTGRSFFGVYRVSETDDPPVRSLVHGTTDHGGQWMPDAGVAKPTTYHTAASPAIEVLHGLRNRVPPPRTPLRVGIVGLGTGALAYHRRDGEAWRYYEIDPLIEWLALESGYFDIMSRHDPDAPVVLGDARLTLAREPSAHFDLLVLEAFTSDAIPVHLLTREAFALYMSKLGSGGVLLAHISNRLLDLEPVVAGAVAELGYAARTGYLWDIDEESDPTTAPSDWVAVARDETTLDSLDLGGRWEPLDLSDQRPWRDDFSNLAGVIRWRGAASDDSG